MRKFILVISLVLSVVTNNANAQVKDSTFRKWTVYIINMHGKKVCYTVSFPISKSGNYKKRDEPYFMVTYLGNDIAEVSTSSGYKYKKGGKVELTIGNKKLLMFATNELAWAKDSYADKDFISLMKKQNILRVKGRSKIGSYSIDKYSLNGFTASYNRMKEACK